MLTSNELFSVIESTPASFAKNKHTILYYSLILVLQEKEIGALFLTSPGFRPPLSEYEKDTIVQVVLLDSLVGFFYIPSLVYIGKFLRWSSGCRLFLPDSVMQQVKQLIFGLCNSSGYESVETVFRIMNILATVDDRTAWKEAFSVSLGASQVADKINKVKNYVKDNFRNRIKASDAAAIAGLSHCHFARFFRHHTGMTFLDYVHSVRIEEASRLLLKTDDTVTGIAFSCGFNSLNHFHDLFKRYTGRTPGKLRIEN